MTLREIFNKFNIESSLHIHAFGVFDLEIKYTDVDRQAAWDLYIELITRITTQPLDDEAGNEQTALDSVYGIFKLTRDILHKTGPKAANFAKVAVLVLNKVLRPFTSKWHKLSSTGAFQDEALKKSFRAELSVLQENVLTYTDILSAIAGLDENIERLDSYKPAEKPSK